MQRKSSIIIHKASNVPTQQGFHCIKQVFHDMANFVRSESVVRDAVNFCADSDVIEVSSDRVLDSNWN